MLYSFRTSRKDMDIDKVLQPLSFRDRQSLILKALRLYIQSGDKACTTTENPISKIEEFGSKIDELVSQFNNLNGSIREFLQVIKERQNKEISNVLKNFDF